jgi:hypothetical protein
LSPLQPNWCFFRYSADHKPFRISISIRHFHFVLLEMNFKRWLSFVKDFVCQSPFSSKPSLWSSNDILVNIITLLWFMLFTTVLTSLPPLSPKPSVKILLFTIP